MKTSPWLKNQSEAVGDRSINRSRLRTESGRRKFASPTKKMRQSVPHSQELLIFTPPNEPG